jgi:hypothetical protein
MIVKLIPSLKSFQVFLSIAMLLLRKGRPTAAKNGLICMPKTQERDRRGKAAGDSFHARETAVC